MNTPVLLHERTTSPWAYVTALLSLLAIALLSPHSLMAQDAIALVNPSFEQNADGNEPCVQVTDFSEVPGWSMDTPPDDSGVSENGNATDGICAAWLASFDPSLWQLTETTIQAGAVYTLLVDARSSWQTTTFDAMLYYDDNGTRVPVATTTWDFEGISEPMREIEVTIAADDVPDAIGQLLGVAVKNTTPNDPDTGDDDAWAEVDNFRLSVSTTTSVDALDEVPHAFVLEQNYPNPFNPETEISYQVRTAGHLHLAIFDLLGQHIRTLVDASLPAGSYSTRWDGLNEAGQQVPSGLYLYRMTLTGASAASTSTASRTMMLIK